jgi:hypothetical protein
VSPWHELQGALVGADFLVATYADVTALMYAMSSMRRMLPLICQEENTDFPRENGSVEEENAYFPQEKCLVEEENAMFPEEQGVAAEEKQDVRVAL